MKLAKVSVVTKVVDATGAMAEGVGAVVASVASKLKGEKVAATGRSHVGNYLGLAEASETHLAESLQLVAKHHGHEPDIRQMTELLATWSLANKQALAPLIARYNETPRNGARGTPPGSLSRPSNGWAGAAPRPPRPLAPDRGSVALLRVADPGRSGAPG